MNDIHTEIATLKKKLSNIPSIRKQLAQVNAQLKLNVDVGDDGEAGEEAEDGESGSE